MLYNITPGTSHTTGLVEYIFSNYDLRILNESPSNSVIGAAIVDPAWRVSFCRVSFCGAVVTTSLDGVKT